jgi:hypothetical protein
MGQHQFVTTGLIYKNTEGVVCVGTAGVGDSYPSRVSDYLGHTASARVAICRAVNPLQRLRYKASASFKRQPNEEFCRYDV